MEGREDLKSILEYLPVVVRSCSLFWPPQVVDALKVLAGGPDQSGVHSGELLFIAISDLRHSLLLSSHPFAPSAPYGYALFFNELMSRGEARKWFGEVVPALANLLLRLPALLEYHYQNAGDLIHGVKTGLRLLDSQEAGIVLLSQELISALLGCSLFCLFPTNKRGARHLPTINCDHLFAALYDSYSEQQENKIRCIIHYFERISCHMPEGFVSFERKVLPLKHDPLSISYPKASFWSKSDIPLCCFEVNSSDSGLIEDQSSGALEVDFANKNIGGGALRKGCVQEEIRFMINPELIASMLFMPSMEDNEAIEIIGAERFSDYTGYASSFRFAGDYVDTRDVDSLRRRKTRIIAIDALCSPGMRQYKQDFLLRETNKAFCGFFQQSKDQHNKRLFREDGCSGVQLHPDVKDSSDICSDNRLLQETSENSDEVFGGQSVHQQIRDSEMSLDNEDDEVGIATGNWGCGAFGGDPEVKAVVQWLAASQAERPFILYYTLGSKALRNIEQVTRWIRSHEWTVGDLWNLLVEYSTQRLKGETDDGFFTWLLPSLFAPHHDTDMLDLPISP
ncbi:poly(ADP-ribose) glycohydrolase 1-like isoform X1 [Malus sylvestris]|uniref:poly(ADP-ribose) glycohydrolase 1-like isoform X1 n=1 Tax=Malus sylvestris TaxID=3752 RepID=UPI0021AC54F1|nr:poly(ADP-ribose) glycohydrolase 1-like isoform X1 [Malus sylvestris]